MPIPEKSKQEAASEEIERIRRNGFNPGGEVVDSLLLEREPERALLIMRAAARAYRKFVPLH